MLGTLATLRLVGRRPGPGVPWPWRAAAAATARAATASRCATTTTTSPPPAPTAAPPGALFLVDGLGVAYRQFYGLGGKALTTSGGKDTRLVYGFTNYVLSLLREHRPARVAVVFDTPRSTGLRNRMILEHQLGIGSARGLEGADGLPFPEGGLESIGEDSQSGMGGEDEGAEVPLVRGAAPAGGELDLGAGLDVSFRITLPPRPGAGGAEDGAPTAWEGLPPVLPEELPPLSGAAAMAPYKSHRPPMPEELRQGLSDLRAILEALGVAVIDAPTDYEADDVIATLATSASKRNKPSVIVSNDKDFLQLLGPLVSILKPTPLSSAQSPRPELLDAVWFEAEFGVPPERHIDILALAGDASDGIPGLKGIGPVTAQKLVKEHGTVKQILTAVRATPKAFTPARLRALQASDGLLELCRDLVTLQRRVPDVPGEEEIVAFTPDRIDQAALQRVLDDLELGRCKETLNRDFGTSLAG